jgi:glutaminyl-tRNA synthetase
VRGTLHWVSGDHSISAEVRLYDRLFAKADPTDVEEGSDFKANVNPYSLETLTDARLEPSLADAEPGSMYQFERVGYFCVDTVDSAPGMPVFNLTVPLRDSWAKIEKAQKQK